MCHDSPYPPLITTPTPSDPTLPNQSLSTSFLFLLDPLSLIRVAYMSMGRGLFIGSWASLTMATALKKMASLTLATIN